MHFPGLAEYAVVGPPDWFLPGALATSHWNCTTSGGYALIAFSSKPYVYLFLLELDSSGEKPSYKAVLVGQLLAHHDRIAGVSLCTSPVDWTVLSTVGGGEGAKPFHLCTCGQDGLVRHWMHADSEWLLTQELNVRTVNETLLPTAVDSYFSTGFSALLVLVGCNKGHIIVWSITEISENPSYISKKFETEEVLTCAWGLDGAYPGQMMFALGYRKGLVGVYLYKCSSVTSGQALTQLSRFHAHERDICTMFWRPCQTVPDGERSGVELITASRDQLVKVWDVTKSWCSSSVRVPGSARSSAHSKDTDRMSKDKGSSVGTPWITACCLPTLGNQCAPDPNILVSGLRGEIYQWSVSDNSAPPKPVSPTGLHTMLIFVARTIPNSPALFVTVSQDRQVIVWQRADQNSLSPIIRIPTLSGGVSALAQSEHGNGPVAVGVSDGSLLLWRPSAEQPSSGGVGRDLMTLWPRGQNANSITALAWHPSARQESLLAYGTESGCVDLLDVSKPRKSGNAQKSKTQPYIFGSTVYRVTWGPRLFDRPSGTGEPKRIDSSAADKEGDTNLTETPKETTESDVLSEHTEEPSTGSGKFSFYVYSVCKGKIFCHLGFQRSPLDVTLKFPIPSGVNVDEWSDWKRTDISFLQLDKPRAVGASFPPGSDPIAEFFDWIVSIGYRDGHVDVYGHQRSSSSEDRNLSDLYPICSISNHTKGINFLAWSYGYYRLAVGSNEHFITVMDLTEILLAATESRGSCVQLSSCLARLEGHCNRITCLDWSPHEPDLLLSASFDGTANVWSISGGGVSGNDGDCSTNSEKYRSVANFRAPRLRLFACLWSRTEPDLAFSGGELRHLLGWRPSKLVHTDPPNTRRYRPPPIKRPQTVGLSNGNDSAIAEPHLLNSTIPSDRASPVHAESKDQSSLNSVQSDPDAKPITAKKLSNKTASDRQRKRPSLFPHFLHRDVLLTSEVDLTMVPPVRPSSKLSQLLHTLNWLRDGLPLPDVDQDLLFLLPEHPVTRRKLIRFLAWEADCHLQTYRTAQKINGLMHLDAYCMILLWISRSSSISSTLIAERHMPFWLLWCLQLAQSTAPWACTTPSDPGSGDNQPVDLLGEKVKDMMSTQPDVLVSATILISAGRSREAVDFLYNHERIKEALLLARVHLNPQEAWSFVGRCVERMLERKLLGDVPHLGVIYELGCNARTKANSLIQRSLFIQSGSRVDQLACWWTHMGIIARDVDDDSTRLTAFLQLASACLIVGFELDGEEVQERQQSFFNRWKLTFDNVQTETANSLGLSCFLALMDTALLLSAVLNDCPPIVNTSMPYYVKKDQTVPFLQALEQLASDRQPSNHWPTCLMHFTVDLTASMVLCRTSEPANDKDGDERGVGTAASVGFEVWFTRVERAAQVCLTVNPTEAERLIKGALAATIQLSPNDFRISGKLAQLIPKTICPE